MVIIKSLFISILTLFYVFSSFAQNPESVIKYDTIQGKIIDKESKEPLIFAIVAVHDYKSNEPITAVQSDLEGNYQLVLERGIYDIKIHYVSYKTRQFRYLMSSFFPTLDFELETDPSYRGCCEIDACCGGGELQRKIYDTTSGRIFTSKDIENSPLKW